MIKRFVVANTWSTHEIRQLQNLVAARTPVQQIAKILGRTESAIRNKAAMHGIPMRGLTSSRDPS